MIIFQNITAFLMNQNQQFEDVMNGLTYAKEILNPARYSDMACPHACPHAFYAVGYEIMTYSPRWMSLLRAHISGYRLTSRFSPLVVYQDYAHVFP
jgi:hypothetical protein